LVFGITILVVYALEYVSSPFGLVSASPVVLDLGLVGIPGRFPSPWSWITFEFVHASEIHVFLNLLGLILISPIFEERIGSLRWGILFFAGGAFGAAVFLVVHLSAVVVLVGASAGIFGVFGAYGRLYPRDRVTLFIPLPGLPTIPVAQLVVIFLVLEMLLGFLGPRGIAWEAHVGALAFGFAAAPAVMRLPLHGKGRHLTPVGGLRNLATTPELEKLFEEAEAADIPETREAWIEKFVAKARCPRCGGPVRWWFGRIVSKCGWRQSL
ncbi:MAG: rhomboid family intramembrane serine protease, partial [Thermoplasmata archaeon]|nr:rhomboid family intramembrane serine protease [Thermoplasmata archaeon]